MGDPAPTAQDTYREFLRDHVAPRLRTGGWVGSGNEFRFPDADAWALLGFQKTRHSTAQVVSYTVNVLVVSHQGWEQMRAARPILPEQPKASLFVGLPAWQSRIGHLLPVRADTWWDLPAGSTEGELAEMAQRLAGLVETYVVPQVHARLEQVKVADSSLDTMDTFL